MILFSVTFICQYVSEQKGNYACTMLIWIISAF